uniref:RING-type E3 ubiquitin transferase n=1 Tax=Oryza punctata TaxID=4537 RepID=A0A0E0JM61_ORYPU
MLRKQTTDREPLASLLPPLIVPPLLFSLSLSKKGKKLAVLINKLPRLSPCRFFPTPPIPFPHPPIAPRELVPSRRAIAPPPTHPSTSTFPRDSREARRDSSAPPPRGWRILHFTTPPLPPSFGLPSNQVVLGSMDEGSRNENAGESARGFIKRKNAAVAGSYHCANGFASSSSSSHASLNPTHRPWDPSFESNVLPNTASYNPSEYHSQTSWPSMEGSSIPSNGFNLMGAHPESAQHGNYAFPTSHISQCFQPTSNTWISQAANGIADGIPQWEYVNGMNNPPGRFPRSGMTETVNGSFHEYQNGPSTLCRGPLPYFHQHAGMHAHNLLDHTQVQAPYQQCHNNPVLHGVNHSGNRFHLGPRIPVLFSNSERTFGPPHHPFLANPVNHRNIRILPPEHATIMDFSRLYEVSNVVDEHRDMRLDIDSMTYEELLALEEQIGDVNTGLAKSYIVEKLKTSLYVPGSSCMSNKSSESSMENDACIICQEEYQVKECIGTLDCGHRYHEDCIKQWLMVKNLCPICKTTALSTGRRSG